jgi:hypothetical protein
MNVEKVGIVLRDFSTPDGAVIAVTGDKGLVKLVADAMARERTDWLPSPDSPSYRIERARVDLLRDIADEAPQAEGELIARPLEEEPAWWPTVNSDKEVHQSEQ